MNLLEYEAKHILKEFSIPVPEGVLIRGQQTPDVTLPAVVKSQVPIGGRGKAGGVALVSTQKELEVAIERISQLSIKGFIPKTLLVEEALAISRELYLALMIDRTSNQTLLVAHAEGGVDIESLDESGFFKRPLNPRALDAVAEELADYLELPNKAFVLADLVENLFKCFTKSDALLLEINPLVLTQQGKLVAGDGKMTLDASARFRHPEWSELETKEQSANFVTLDPHGTVATIANGAGLAMATVDAITSRGLTPANFLDIGGNATTEGIRESFNQLVEFNNLTNIVINIFGGIVRCDTVAAAIITARAELPSLPPLQIRLSGTNADEARKLLENEGLTLHDSLESCLEEIAS